MREQECLPHIIRNENEIIRQGRPATLLEGLAAGLLPIFPRDANGTGRRLPLLKELPILGD